MEHPTSGPSQDDTTPDAVVLPEVRHDPSNDALPPLIGPDAATPTLQGDAGRPILPPPPTGEERRMPSEAWRPGGGVHGHDQPVRPIEPLAGIEDAPRRVALRRPASNIHQGAPMQRRRTGAGTIAAVGLVAALVGGSAALGGAAMLGAFDDPEPTQTPATAAPIVQITEIVPGIELTPASAVGLKVVPSIVTVEVGTDDPSGTFRPLGSGSGVVLNADGAIATNHHVVGDADQVRVTFQDGRIYDAELVGSDRITDLAVIRIEGNGLTPIELGSTEQLVIGDTAIAVGNPLGLSGGPSLTVGVVSAFEREVQVGPAQGDRLFGMLQTDAPITNGSSGGALVDSEGRLIGITTAIGVSEAGAEGIGFAIPVELVIRITDELLERGDVRHAFLGVGLRDFLLEEGSARIPGGATISNIEPDTSAAAFGLSVGDRIVSLDGASVMTTQDVINTLRLYRVGDLVTVEVVRDGATLTFEVELGERPEGI